MDDYYAALQAQHDARDNTEKDGITAKESPVLELNGTESWKLYSTKVKALTLIFRPAWFPNKQSDQEVNHKFSIYHGWQQNIPIKYIANRNNQQLLTKAQCQAKGDNSDITRDELIAQYKPSMIDYEWYCQKIDDMDDPQQIADYAISYLKPKPQTPTNPNAEHEAQIKALIRKRQIERAHHSATQAPRKPTPKQSTPNTTNKPEYHNDKLPPIGHPHLYLTLLRTSEEYRTQIENEIEQMLANQLGYNDKPPQT